ncbi:MAG: hypothetical protein AB8B80_10230 [Marinicellaceae bacterium]
MKKQNIIGLLLLISGCILTFISFNLVQINEAYHFGRLLGQTLILSLIAIVIIYFTGFKNKFETLLIIGSILLIVSIYNSAIFYIQINNQLEFKESSLELIENIQSRKAIVKNIGDNDDLKLFQLTENYASNLQAIREEYNSELSKVFLLNPLLPSNLTNQDSISASLKNIELIQINIPKYESRMLEEISNFEQLISNRNDKESKSFLAGFKNSKYKGIKWIKAFYQNQFEIFQTIKEILSHVNKLKDNLTFENEMIIFSSQNDVDIYNELNEKLQKLSLEEEKMMQAQADSSKEMAEKLKE